jgi:hypothetical protein
MRNPHSVMTSRRAHSHRGVEERINACRLRLRASRATQKTRAVHPQDEAQHEESLSSSSSVELAEASRMSSVAEILREAGRELSWLEDELSPEVDEGTPGRTGLDVKEEVGTA